MPGWEAERFASGGNKGGICLIPGKGPNGGKKKQPGPIKEVAHSWERKRDSFDYNGHPTREEKRAVTGVSKGSNI